ncbi:MAG: cysteine desulfurase [Alphaproteobacteria bacterium]|nr:cysteine desulfurase [Alphaproteobacteria bacterium]
MYDVYEIRKDFPVLSEKINGKPNIFLDSAASAQKPYAVINRLNDIYSRSYANVHRGIYRLSEEITAAYEEAREVVRDFINANSADEIIFTRNATESINLVAATWGRKFLKPGDEVLISQAEHHANLVPWQMLRDEIGFSLKIFPIADDGSYLEEEFLKALTPRTKLVAVTGMSNVLGTVFPVKQMAAAAHRNGALFLVDACQYIVHQPVDVQDLDCDFLAFSGHKTYGPTGIGILYGKFDLLDSMPPYQTGGDMVDVVTYDQTTFMPPPARFEAGTPACVQAIGLGEALRYMKRLGMDNIKQHEDDLTAYAREQWENVPGLTLVGTAKEKGGVFSFVVDGIHPQDLAFVLDKEGIAVRVGHHCAEPLVHRMGYESVARASFGLYTTKEDIDALLPAIRKAQKMLL